ncbi:cytochrome P450 [Actinocrispum wychmicini]|uniref:Cytochrome P450 n=1 Tax=Actinocrispum wychmicini TaxID=1213861 RepID=A0A4R2IMV7_9PSEU|nr:cytochrome P450 [Actinocrispum wychmicini]TCO46531.1 cytochrome P450 [Actinocrispum wychmicini]
MAVAAPPVAPKHIPVLGHVLSLTRDPIGFLQNLRAHGDIVTFYLGTRPVHQINSPELIRQVLVTDARHFSRGKIFAKARQLFGDGLATADEPAHMRQRRVMQPAFHHDRIAGYVNVMREQIDETVGGWVPNKPIMLEQEMAGLTLRVTAKALFQADLGQAAVAEVYRSLDPILNGLAKRSMMPVELFERIPTPGNRRFDAALRRLLAVVDDVIAAYRAGGVDHGDLLSMLVTHVEDDDEVRAQVLNILMAGTETTATTLSWACHELVRHPDVADRVAAEAESVLNGRIGGADPDRMTYVDRVLTETLRLHTPIWLLMRTATATVRLGDVTLRPGAEVMVSMPTLHRDPALFPDPTRFDPDRWQGQGATDLPRMSFIPFGAGGHKCIGEKFAWAEMTVAVAAVCARWRLRLRPGHQVREVARAFLRPNGLPMIPCLVDTAGSAV